ncbi:MAG: signal peptidase II, partial [Chloroflexota bacterium]|nr:signal peptidase II [Chloroflexota bacterium]
GFLLIMSSVVVVLIICLQVFYLRTEIKLMLIGLGLVLGGAIGNLIDRIRFGAVTDFLDVRLWGDFHWAIFNVADAALSTGIVILIYYLLIMAKNIDQPDTHE